ncbi:hypothetical protein Q1F79_001059 [Salmonella enterica]|nr:hypothetical protein [Salmonella enterica subsp. enterica]EKP4811136.1 hypothetical protein [Salmonella enterica]EKP5939649.1 hypothetical protein [Salmonella enterica]ELN0970621.1 hypothetical protein [Salmonella enterica]
MAMNVGLTAEQKIALEALQQKSCDPINEQNIMYDWAGIKRETLLGLAHYRTECRAFL